MRARHHLVPDSRGEARRPHAQNIAWCMAYYWYLIPQTLAQISGILAEIIRRADPNNREIDPVRYDLSR